MRWPSKCQHLWSLNTSIRHSNKDNKHCTVEGYLHQAGLQAQLDLVVVAAASWPAVHIERSTAGEALEHLSDTWTQLSQECSKRVRQKYLGWTTAFRTVSPSKSWTRIRNPAVSELVSFQRFRKRSKTSLQKGGEFKTVELWPGHTEIQHSTHERGLRYSQINYCSQKQQEEQAILGPILVEDEYDDCKFQ